MSSTIEKSIFKTICYADVFGYPLTLKEIRKWLIESRIPCLRRQENPEFRIKRLKNIKEDCGYYFLEGRENIVIIRKEREKYSREKIEIAKRVSKIIMLIPSVKLIGVTGALSMNNAKKIDDIDLFIITSSKLIWTTRLLSTLLTEILGKRRHPGEKSVNNKICLNMFIDENHMEIPQKEQDLFSAHEVLQMKPLWERDNTYKKFLIANQWVKKYLPNVCNNIQYKVFGIKYKNKPLLDYYMVIMLNWIENILKNLQIWYMRKRRTSEIISDGIIRFHPQDAREWVMREYNSKIIKY